MESLWKQTSVIPHFRQLDQDIKTDVLIIGGGLAGILCAFRLQQAGVRYVLVEAETLCSGVTGNTTAKITAQHGLLYTKLIHQFGIEKAQAYLKANLEAIQQYRRICADIPCDFIEEDAFVYSIRDRQKIEQEIESLHKLRYNAAFVKDLPLPFPVAGAVKFAKQAAFHPLKFVAAIVPGLNIYEHTPVRELIGTTACTDHGRIDAEKIIVATHFPFLNKHGSYFLKLYQDRSYVIALKNAKKIHGMYLDEAAHGFSFRQAGDLLLLGGGGHRTGKKGGNWTQLRESASMWYPEAEEVCHWATQDCMPLDGVPYIGRYAAHTTDLYVATGFHKWGMTSAMTAATILCDLVRDRENRYAEVFSPSRSMLRPQLAVNAGEAILHLLTPSTKRCPHLGCALTWNSAEHTWDCPCHGSRFTETGKLIDNPATGDLK